MDRWVHLGRFEHFQEGALAEISQEIHLQYRIHYLTDVCLADVGVGRRVSRGPRHHPQETGILVAHRVMSLMFMFTLSLSSGIPYKPAMIPTVLVLIIVCITRTHPPR